MTPSPRRQIVLALIALVLLVLQGRLWLGEGSLRHKTSLEKRVAELSAENQKLSDRNQLLAADVQDLKKGLDAVEEIARKDLGMVRNGETFFLVIEKSRESNNGTSR
ncbi:MAG: septum formation initiator family protein [Alcanivoracaceae bacterium]|nr:septum formation initiator family protein [Alcanivoracaceae bacterium]